MNTYYRLMLLMNSSGPWSSGKDNIDKLFSTPLHSIVSKTCTLRPNSGNPEPNYVSVPSGISFNCMGLPNEGYEYYRDLAVEYFTTQVKPFIISFSAHNTDDLSIMLADYETRKINRLVEINLSCPNVDSIPAYHADMLSHVMSILEKHDLDYGLKLPPYLEQRQVNETAKIINHTMAQITYIVCSNSIPNCLYLQDGRPTLSRVFGGMSGFPCKYLALANCMQFGEIFGSKIKIIGCGGISTAADLKDYAAVGCTMVAICPYVIDNLE